MKIFPVRAADLTSDQLSRWSEIQHADPDLGSPYFRPEFTMAVSAVSNGLLVGILEDGGRIEGFFPFKKAGRAGWPIAGVLHDFQGIVADKDIEWTAADLLAGCGLKTLHFDHLLGSQKPFQDYHALRAKSPFIDVSGGFEEYEEYKRRSESRVIAKVDRQSRMVERDLGPLRLVVHSTESRVFETLLAWKSDQFERTRAPDIFAKSWVVNLLDRIRETQTSEFSGVLSALYSDQRLLAVHFGMRSRDVFHYWFPAYDPSFGKYSPGSILLLELSRILPTMGIGRIDLGEGSELYKKRFMTGETTLAKGTVDLRPGFNLSRKAFLRAREAVRSSQARRRAESLLKAVRSLRAVPRSRDRPCV